MQEKKIISFDECQIIRKNFNIRDYFSFPNSYTHIFFDQPVVNYGRVSKEEYTIFINNIKKHFSDEIKNKLLCEAPSLKLFRFRFLQRA